MMQDHPAPAPSRLVDTLGILLLCVLFSQSVFGTTQDPVGNFQLSLSREYGRARFRECRLNIVMFERRAIAELRCTHLARTAKGEELPPLNAREDLSAQAAKQLAELVDASALYDGGHVGQDTTSVDGVFEVLKVNSARGAVTLVTSGNPTFTRDKSRQALLSLLTTLEKRLLATAAGVK
jgi:hypothetical protein